MSNGEGGGNGDQTMTVKNTNDPVRVINAVSSSVTAMVAALMGAYFAFSGKVPPAQPPVVPAVQQPALPAEPTNTELKKLITDRLDAIDAKLEYIKPAVKK
jgi:hypothetical protein